MFYVGSVITFILFLDLLRKSTLLVSYMLNIFWPPRVNQFEICELLVWLLHQVHTVKLNSILWLAENLPSVSSLTLQLY